MAAASRKMKDIARTNSTRNEITSTVIVHNPHLAMQHEAHLVFEAMILKPTLGTFLHEDVFHNILAGCEPELGFLAPISRA
jgi:hypothetical protein